MKNLFTLAVVSYSVYSVTAFAAKIEEVPIHCWAEGPSLSSQGSRDLIKTFSHFSFYETRDKNGLRVLIKIKGSIKTANEDYQGSYIGTFDLPSKLENSNYKPQKYTGYSQFPNFDATSTEGSLENGMWGQFLLEKDYQDKDIFQAHYIFQAGDHMGGTLHLECKVEN
jgi:hypothetical protein